MKNVVKSFVLISLIIVFATSAHAQTTQKIGFIDFNGLVANNAGRRFCKDQIAEIPANSY